MISVDVALKLGAFDLAVASRVMQVLPLCSAALAPENR